MGSLGDRVSISPTDVADTKAIFDANGWPLPQRYFRYFAVEDCWELYRIQPNGTKTLVAVYDGTYPESGSPWVEV